MRTWSAVAAGCTFILLIMAGVAAYSYYVWPGQWTYEKSGYLVVRTNRFDDRTERLTTVGWKAAAYQDAPSPSEYSLSSDELSRLDVNIVNASITPDGRIQVQIYNGTRRTLRTVDLLVTVTNESGVVLSRLYEFKLSMGTAGPLGSEMYEAHFGYNALSPGQKFSSMVPQSATADP